MMEMRNAECGKRNEHKRARRAGSVSDRSVWRFSGRSRSRIAVISVFVLLLPSVAFAQDVNLALMPAELKPIRLSEFINVTLTIEGPAPLRVELPKPLLVPEADRDWKIQPSGTATVTALAGQREKWSQTFRLDPYVPGDMYVQFAPVKVNGRENIGPGVTVKVNTTISEAKPEAARPVTTIEELPVPPVRPSDSPWPWILPAAALVVILAVALWQLRRKPPLVSPTEWAAAAFARLERDGVSGAALVERVAAILREFIDRRFGIPAPRLTTPELLAATEQTIRPVEETDALRGILDRCDRAKFAGDIPDDSGCRDLLTRSREWVHHISAADAEPG
jgi:hypothetical protein